jgi:hypothetical protein
MLKILEKNYEDLKPSEKSDLDTDLKQFPPESQHWAPTMFSPVFVT